MSENNIAKKEEDFKLFLEILTNIGKKIEQHYFRIQTAGSEEYVNRERVYCYELYHRLREMLPSNFNYNFDGELDKRGQEVFQSKNMKYIPDFIVHKSGDMTENLVTIEVKNINSSDFKEGSIRHDIYKLIRFVEDADYFRGVMLIYSDDLDDFPQDLKDLIKDKIKNRQEEILILFHSRPNKRIEQVII